MALQRLDRDFLVTHCGGWPAWADAVDSWLGLTIEPADGDGALLVTTAVEPGGTIRELVRCTRSAAASGYVVASHSEA